MGIPESCLACGAPLTKHKRADSRALSSAGLPAAPVGFTARKARLAPKLRTGQGWALLGVGQPLPLAEDQHGERAVPGVGGLGPGCRPWRVS